MNQTRDAKPLGFWSCWSLTVGCMIGSGVFMLPAVLAPYGLLSFGGWILAGLGSIALALVFARQAARTTHDGGPYAYARNAFGPLVGFMMGWNYWLSYMIGIPVVAIAFVGYLEVFVPFLHDNAAAQAGAAMGLIGVLTIINLRGLREMSAVQILLTLLKIVPLVAIVALGFSLGAPDNLPTFNPTAQPVIGALAAVALITLWPFTGFEVSTLPAGHVRDPQRTIPRALVWGMLTVTAIYLSATAAVMLLVPAEDLATSTAPFSDAAAHFGAWGPPFIAAGALVATAGTLNGLIFTAGQMPMAVALDNLAPKWLARTNAGGSPHFALMLSSGLGALLLLANYSRGLLGAFTFLLMMSTSLALIYYLVVSLAELRESWRSARAWVSVAVFAAAYSIFATLGSGLEVLGWGLMAMAASVPLYFLWRRPAAQVAN
ncbi:MAG: amino acid permease [Hyphomonadaceae bacterium]